MDDEARDDLPQLITLHPLVAPAAAPIHAPKARPDPRPMRALLGAGGLAALSAVVTAIVLPPQASPAAGPAGLPDPTDPAATPILVQRPIVYVQLQPGQTAPPGATVIDPDAPTPITVVTVVAAPQRKTARSAVRTTQSGKPIP